MYKTAAIGERGDVYGFAAVGADVIAVNSPDECAEAFIKASGGGYGVLFITENYAPTINPLIKTPFPAVMYIPNGKGIAEKELHDITKKAVGADLLF